MRKQLALEQKILLEEQKRQIAERKRLRALGTESVQAGQAHSGPMVSQWLKLEETFVAPEPMENPFVRKAFKKQAQPTIFCALTRSEAETTTETQALPGIKDDSADDNGATENEDRSKDVPMPPPAQDEEKQQEEEGAQDKQAKKKKTGRPQKSKRQSGDNTP